MSSIKEATLESIRRLPNECSIDDIMYQINLVAQVFEGLEDADAGRLVSTQELIARLDQWSK